MLTGASNRKSALKDVERLAKRDVEFQKLIATAKGPAALKKKNDRIAGFAECKLTSDQLRALASTLTKQSGRFGSILRTLTGVVGLPLGIDMATSARHFSSLPTYMAARDAGWPTARIFASSFRAFILSPKLKSLDVETARAWLTESVAFMRQAAPPAGVVMALTSLALLKAGGKRSARRNLSQELVQAAIQLEAQQQSAAQAR